MTDLKFEDLSREQLDHLVDDCGKPGFLDVPDFIFSIACQRHDFDYWLGHTKIDRHAADARMYRTMKSAIASEPWYRRFWLYPIASTYYWAVRIGSSRFFYYDQRKRTLEDLQEEMGTP